VREYNDLVKLAERAALRAADYLRTAPRPAVATWTEKSQHDFVTEIDRAAEAMIADVITREEPGSVIVGEELSPKRAEPGSSRVITSAIIASAAGPRAANSSGSSIRSMARRTFCTATRSMRSASAAWSTASWRRV